ncbi:GIY-YIG nuclease family protein [Niastella populi]|uniref:Bacteriophage T5 Orf172 DNA-binding domain-containing protein n=1 Tax=Niastella populi TaxID=550983 RepID=A0A1V9G352_9BACT|nr:GIY-YIG nuclease family protein [Niastella populi]OQP65002.1 hypothetical protein A4R26_14920 [Niastella populi]
MSNKFFPKRPVASPILYVYELIDVPSHTGLLKVGYTFRSSEIRIDEQTKTAAVKYRILHEESAMKNDGTAFIDREVHRLLRKKKIKNPCSGRMVKSSVRLSSFFIPLFDLY